MLHLLSKREEGKNVPLMLQTSLPKLSSHMDRIIKIIMSSLPQTHAPWQLRRLLKICQRYQACPQLHGQQLKNKIKMSILYFFIYLALKKTQTGNIF